ncbi:Multidrug resistance-associated protein 1 [Mortierella sp. AM989]|nr:Multidrug resistance-associated protein 1 [Mortierella sp. AM989]
MLDLVSSLETWQFLTSGYRQNRAQYFSGAYIPEFVDGLCIHSEGWGPLSPTRYDLTPCFEYSVLFGALSLFAVVVFVLRIYYLRVHGIAHHLGRTAWIYWPTQICMTLAAVIAWLLSLQFVFLPAATFPIAAWSCISLAIAWGFAVVLNRYEHEYEIRSSSAIYSFYVVSIASSLVILKTSFDLESTGDLIIVLLVALTSILTVGFVVEAWPRGSTKVQQLSGVGLYGKANLGSRLLFTFYLPFIRIGLRRTLTQDDILGQLPKDMEIEVVHKKLGRAWNERLRKRKRPQDSPSLFMTIIASSWPVLVPVLLSRVAIVLFSYTLPVLLRELLNYLEDYESKPVSYGITLAVGMFMSSLFASLLNTYNRYQMLLIGVKTRAALIAMIYRKALRLSVRSRNETSNGEITNHMSVDADQWWDMVVYVSMWISIPIEVAISMKLLYDLLGWTMLAGVLVMVAMLPLQTWQARVIKRVQAEKLKAMDQRVNMTTDVLASMKVIKLYGWSAAFMSRILAVRQKELEALRKMGIVQAFMSIIFISSSLIISLVTFSAYALWGGPNFTPGQLTPQTVFVSMTLFSMLKGPIASLSDATTSTIGVLVATKRIQKFLLKEEVNDNDILRFDSLPRDPQEPVISIKDATFSWTGPIEEKIRDIDERSALISEQDSVSQSSMPPTLQSINLFIGRGSLTAVVGRVGQGKSSLLSAMISDMYKIQGKVQISGKVAYVPQQAWIINKTLRDNILFGKEYDEARYKQVIFACGLEPDLAMLPAGDKTEIGERGINLSGGQKQRVSLARAAYNDADIYLLDDPLSAVDAHVGRHLWNNLLGPSGLLREKTRVLVTHGIHHLQEVDQIVLLNNGVIEENGHYSDLMASKKIFYRLIKEYSILERRRSQSTPSSTKDRNVRRKSTDAAGSAEITEVEAPEYESEDSLDDEPSEVSASDNDTAETLARQEFKDEKKDTKAELIAAELMKEGKVGYGVVVDYARAASYRISILIVVMFLIAQGCLVLTSLWLKHWIKKSEESTDLVLFLSVYSLLTVVYVLLYVVLMWLLFAVARIRAAERIHRNLLDKVLHLPIAFFDTTPLGRIINRFSSDVMAVDIRVPNKLSDVLLFGISVSSTLILIVFTIPSFIFVVPFLVAGYWLVLVCYLSVSIVLVRIYSISKSPVYQHFNESLGGVSTMRAMRIQNQFIESNSALSDRMSNNFLCNMSSRRWVDVQLRLLSTVVLLCTALFAVLGRKHMDPALVGLTLSFAISITEEVTTLVRNICDLQNQLVAMERVLEYTDLKTEAPDTMNVYIPPDWPSHGRICFQNYSTRYREGLDLVIKNVNLEIAPAERVGIVGRTGAGKSSLTLALFRIVEAANSYWAKESDNSKILNPAGAAERVKILTENGSLDEEEQDGGKIEIDGVDISTIGMQDLRQHLAIIPQDPTLFAGTVRENLDPFHELQDADLWEALDRSHLKEFISTLPGGLSFEVSQNGDNFSVGQRSLICLARALLRKTKILIMDEATAAVDVETDELIQKTIRKEFKDRTILTIAHRIKTVMDSDKILVMERGRVLEFDAPNQLLTDKESLFYKLAEQAGEI